MPDDDLPRTGVVRLVATGESMARRGSALDPGFPDAHGQFKPVGLGQRCLAGLTRLSIALIDSV